jgi:hypothetical protein
MSPASLAQSVLEIASVAVTEARELREKHNIKTVNLLEHQDYLREEKPLAEPLVAHLNQLTLTELKKLHVLVQVGEQPSRLQGFRSLSDVFEDLEYTLPGSGDKQSYVQYFTSRIFRLPTLLTECLSICKKRAIDPDEDLARI